MKRRIAYLAVVLFLAGGYTATYGQDTTMQDTTMQDTIVQDTMVQDTMASDTSAYGQQAGVGQQYLELLRSQLGTDRVAILTETMQLPPEESDAFWQIYREYDAERTELGDRQIELLREYVESYNQLTDDEAEELLEESFSLQEDQLELRQEYAEQIADEISPVAAAQFAQVDRQIDMLIDVQVASRTPLIQPPAQEVAE